MTPLHQQFEQFLQQCESFLDSYIDAGSEQELFVSSYIHGHFSVVAASFHNLDDYSELEQLVLAFQQQLKQGIDNAIANNELSSEDAEHVQSMLDKLFSI